MKKLLFLIGFIFCGAAFAEEEKTVGADILVMDFELEDYVKLPQSDEEIAAISNLKTDFRNLLIKAGFQAQSVTGAEWEKFNKSVGYVFDAPERGKDLARERGAKYYAVGKISKPSPLFIYLKVKLSVTETGRPAGNYQVEVKGRWSEMLKRGLKRIVSRLEKRREKGEI